MQVLKFPHFKERGPIAHLKILLNSSCNLEHLFPDSPTVPQKGMFIAISDTRAIFAMVGSTVGKEKGT
ncbi:MAG: hypothetical protein VR65_13360 [Desulfobulbaceae bacterium BRH_c16a]|nr:MAG: hypothetical protein VR65_13360 [Desulfobulbaceae bacterium BRH_c16a]